MQTYIHWGMHEPHLRAYSWEGEADVFSFLHLAASLDLNVILRPGPYICAETTFGGLPTWLGSSSVRHSYVAQHMRFLWHVCQKLRMHAHPGIIQSATKQEWCTFASCDVCIMATFDWNKMDCIAG